MIIGYRVKRYIGEKPPACKQGIGKHFIVMVWLCEQVVHHNAAQYYQHQDECCPHTLIQSFYVSAVIFYTESDTIEKPVFRRQYHRNAFVHCHEKPVGKERARNKEERPQTNKRDMYICLLMVFHMHIAAQAI